MAARDPETGQFVPSGDGLTYDDLEVQHIIGNDALPPAANAGVVYRYLRDYDIAGGGLDRGELGELVGYKINGAFVTSPADVVDVEDAHADWMMGVEPQDRIAAPLLGSPDTVDASDDALQESSDGSDPGIAGGFADYVDNGVWWNFQPHNFLPGSTAGTGGTMHMAHTHANFRDEFGRGPVYDRHNNIFEHWTLAGPGERINFYRSVVLYWNIFEE